MTKIYGIRNSLMTLSVLKVIDGITELVLKLQNVSILCDFHFIDFLSKVEHAQVSHVVFHGLRNLALNSDIIHGVVAFPMNCLFEAYSLWDVFRSDYDVSQWTFDLGHFFAESKFAFKYYKFFHFFNYVIVLISMCKWVEWAKYY